MAAIEGGLSTSPGRFAIVAARFNPEVVEPLIAGAREAFLLHGIGSDAVDLVRVPGAFEIPLAAFHLASAKQYAAVLCLGAVIRGDTDHYQYVCEAATHGILRAGLDSGVPVIFGVLMCETEEQALDRAGGKEGNKGADAALAAMEMADLLAKLK